MITGRVSPDGREALIPLTLLHARTGEARHVEAIIDTGFTDRLTLPPEIADELELPLRGAVEVALADGGLETLPVYRLRLMWQNQERRVRVYAAPGDPLVGMALLSGNELRIRVEPDCVVGIEPLS